VRRLFRFFAAACVAAVFAALLSGCDTTADKSNRAQVAADRVLEARGKHVVKKADPRFSVEQVQTLGRGKGNVVIVRFKNNSDEILTDIPITVGVRSNGKRTLLNGASNLYFFQTHIAAANAKSESVWVLELNKRIPKGKPYALIGAPVRKTPPNAKWPQLNLAVSSAKGKTVIGSIKNESGPQQYVVEIYAFASKGGKYVAAGRTRALRLLSGEEDSWELELEGKLGGAKVETAYGPGIVSD
jgi:hypothetical protein